MGNILKGKFMDFTGEVGPKDLRLVPHSRQMVPNFKPFFIGNGKQISFV